jgi:hypothetical protein
MTTKTTITIRRPEGHEETIDVSAKYPVGLNPALFERIQADNKAAGRGWCLRYETTVDPAPADGNTALTVTFGRRSKSEKAHDRLFNEGGEGYNPHR